MDEVTRTEVVCLKMADADGNVASRRKEKVWLQTGLSDYNDYSD